MATEPNTRDAKLIQYLNEAYGKEKELETALQAHIAMTEKSTYQTRLKDHLKETKAQARGLQSRIKALGGKAEQVHVPGPEIASEAATAAVSLANKAVSAVKGQGHMIRGTGESEKLLKNAKTELFNEYEEIGNYIAIEELASTVGDTETAKLAREYRKQEERMASFLQKEIPRLTKKVARDEIPAAERRSSSNGGTRRRRSSSSSSRTTSRSTSSRSGSSSSARKATTQAKRSTTTAAKSTKTAAKRTATAAKKTGTAARKTASSAAKRTTSGSSRSSSSRAKKS